VSAPVLAAYEPVLRDRAPVRFGAAVAAFTGAPLFVVSVYASDEVVDRLAGGQMGEDLPSDPTEALAEVAGELDGRGLSVETLSVGATSAPRALDIAAVEIGAGLLVVGSARRGYPGRLAPGETARRLLNGSPCAVALVPQQWDGEGPPGMIGAGFVETPDGHAAVHGAQTLARWSGARLRVLSAVQPRSWMIAGAGERAGAGAAGSGDAPGHEHRDAALAEVADDLRTRAENAAAEAPAILPDVAANVDVAVMDPADFLLRVSAEVDVLVCGSRCYGPHPAALLGGVTQRVIAEASCPVILLARGPEVELEALGRQSS
jgi:nucleotide-binding universal stress UspA family protein